MLLPSSVAGLRTATRLLRLLLLLMPRIVLRLASGACQGSGVSSLRLGRCSPYP